MKKKIAFIILLIVFVGALIGLNVFLNRREETVNEEQGSAEVESINEQEISKVVLMNYDTFQTEVLASEKKVLVDFYADWCPPCKALSPIIEEVANENTDENVMFVRINIDEEEELANEYGILSIPTLVVIKNGEEVNRSVGYIEKHAITKLLDV